MAEKRHPRRFIAGAVCPRCGLMDKIVVDVETDRRLCVSCGFGEDRPGLPVARPSAAATPETAELPTRVSRASARRVQTPAQPIRMIDSVRDSGEPED